MLESSPSSSSLQVRFGYFFDRVLRSFSKIASIISCAVMLGREDDDTDSSKDSGCEEDGLKLLSSFEPDVWEVTAAVWLCSSSTRDEAGEDEVETMGDSVFDGVGVEEAVREELVSVSDWDEKTDVLEGVSTGA